MKNSQQSEIDLLKTTIEQLNQKIEKLNKRIFDSECRIDKLTGRRVKVDPSVYASWSAFKAACSNHNHPSYSIYGGKGIQMDSLWERNSFAFCEYIKTELGDRPKGKALVRIDKTKDIEPGNLKWGETRPTKKVVQVDLITNAVVNTFDSVNLAAASIGIAPTTLSNIVRGTYPHGNRYEVVGFLWRFESDLK